MASATTQGSAALSALPGLPRPNDFGVGKWSRVATYGVKKQRQPDGTSRTFNFDDGAFAQGLQNFRRMFAGRGKGMGSDYEHQTLNAAINGQAAPNLCYWTAMAVIDQAGQVAGVVDLRGDAVALDPSGERARLAAQNPAEDPDPAGVWVYCGEITPLGLELIPNYSQLSPLFNDEDVDEQEQPVGFAFQNISFVNLAFQGGTSFNFGKGLFMNEMDPAVASKLAKFGFSADKPEGIDGAFSAYLEGSPDSPEDRGKVAQAYRKMKKMSADAQSGGPGTLPAGAPTAVPNPAAPGQMGGMLPDAEGMAKMSRIHDAQLATLSNRVKDAEARLEQHGKEQAAKEQREGAVRLAAFRKEMLESDNARFLPQQAGDLDQLISDLGGDLDKTRRHAERLPPVSAFQRLTQGGNPIGLGSVPPPGISSMSKTQKGFAFNKAVRELRVKEPALTFEAAQQRIASEQPELYSGSL